MFNNLYFTDDNLRSSDLGMENIKKFYSIVENIGSNKKFVDLGVRQGYSSSIMLKDAESKNNTVYGVDVDFNLLNPALKTSKKYFNILADTVTLGKRWNEGNIDILFVDTLHTKEQVLSELYFWHDKVNEDGYIIFHDTGWEEGKKDTIAGIVWDRVEEALFDFYKINSLNIENDYIKVEHSTEGYGMTFLKIKKSYNYKKDYSNWDEVFKKRNFLMNYLFKDKDISNIIISLNITNE